MKQKAKIIIAREGLIIISLLLLAGISFWLDSHVRVQKRTYEANVQELAPYTPAPLTPPQSKQDYSGWVDGPAPANATGMKPVTDPDILAQLNAPDAAPVKAQDSGDGWNVVSTAPAPAVGGPWEDYQPAPATPPPTVPNNRYKLSVHAEAPDESKLTSDLGPWVDIYNGKAVTDKRAEFDVEGARKAGYGNTEIANYLGIIVRFPKGTNDSIIEQALKKDSLWSRGTWGVLNSPIETVYFLPNNVASYDEKGQKLFDGILYKISFASIGMFFLICAYPIYLLGRFIIWAVWTLKE
ncbi:MAG: hypothetical protein WA666_07155 [Nitrospirota bacterium]